MLVELPRLQRAHGVQAVVIDTVPAFRHGLQSALVQVGFEVSEPDSVASWRAEVERGLMLLSLDGRDNWSLLNGASLDKNATVVALLPDDEASRYHHALSAGAGGAVSRDAEVDTMLSVVDAALSGTVLLPVEVARELVGDRVVGKPPSGISHQEVKWLVDLAHGVTVHDLAAHSCLSERSMHRRLRGLYSWLGVETRSEAIALASGWE